MAYSAETPLPVGSSRRLPAMLPARIAPVSLVRSLCAYGAIALALRMVFFGNPLVHVDEQFYLLVGERWAHGALPYVDIWDRKPIGLFLLYRLFAILPGDPLLTSQIGGIVATAATAQIIRRLAREIASPDAAWLAGLVYVMAMPAFSCAFGQAPVFYNPLVAGAVLLLVEAARRGTRASLATQGAGIMVLIGIALQIKYSALFEGIAIGIMLLALARAKGCSWPRVAACGVLWATIALAPTLLAWGSYAAIGQGDTFAWANFVSIMHRLPDGSASWRRLATQMLGLAPFWLAILMAPGSVLWVQPGHPVTRAVLGCWAAAAIAGYLLFGTWYDHYVAPMLPPLCVLAAPVLTRGDPENRRYGQLLLAASAIGGLTVMGIQFYHHGTAAQFNRLTETIRADLHGGTFYQFDGEPGLYRSVGAPIPTAYAFPSHLNTFTEAPAIGVEPAREVARIMLTRPQVVLIGEWQDFYLPNPMSRAVVRDFLARDYVRERGVVLGTHNFGLYRLKSREDRIASR